MDLPGEDRGDRDDRAALAWLLLNRCASPGRRVSNTTRANNPVESERRSDDDDHRVRQFLSRAGQVFREQADRSVRRLCLLQDFYRSTTDVVFRTIGDGSTEVFCAPSERYPYAFSCEITLK